MELFVLGCPVAFLLGWLLARRFSSFNHRDLFFLAGVYRSRGDVAQAIALHEGLLAQLALTLPQKTLVRFALVDDYRQAGLLDSAERCLLSLLEELSEHSLDYQKATGILLSLYEQEKDWERALDVGLQWAALSQSPDAGVRLAHYLCEQIEMMDLATVSEAMIKRSIDNALDLDPRSVRACLLYGDYLFQQGKYIQAIDYYQSIAEKDPAFVTIMAARMVSCYARLGAGPESFETFIAGYLKGLLEQYPSLSLLLLYQRYAKVSQALWEGVLEKQLSHYSLCYALNDYIRREEADQRERFFLGGFLRKIFDRDLGYYCVRCGFLSHRLDWQCPSCHQWSCIKPKEG